MAKSFWARRFWAWWRRPSARLTLGTLLVLGFAGGVLFTGGFNSFVASTNTKEFCLSCHAMREFVYPEYQQSTHYSNVSGVRADCADCHVPQAWVPKMQRKIKATFVEVPSHLLGKINTREKFEAHRLVMAQRVWATMKADDSRACRSCHDHAAMALVGQKPRAREQHEEAERSGETCIDCHQGIAHRMPDLPEDKVPAQEEDFAL